MIPGGKIQVWFDGSCDADGRSAYAFIVASDHRVVFSAGGFHERRAVPFDASVGDYAALLCALKFLLAHDITHATVFGDSTGVIETASGRLRARSRHRVYVDEARALLARLPRVRLIWIPRSFNGHASTLARAAMRNHTTLDAWGDPATLRRKVKPTDKGRAAKLRRKARQLLTRVIDLLC